MLRSHKTPDAMCSVCRKCLVGYTPKGGDGSALFVPRHVRTLYRFIGGLQTQLYSEKCPGSNREAAGAESGALKRLGSGG